MKRFLPSSSSSSSTIVFWFPFFLLLVHAKTSTLKNALWNDPKVEYNSQSKVYDISVSTSPRTDSVTVEYGFEARPILSLASSLSSRRLWSNQEYPSSVVGRRNHAGTTTRRGLQEEEEEKDPFFVFGGTIKGSMKDNFFSASWDLSFYVLMETAANKESEIYVLDKEDGKPKTFPCIYFPEGSNITTAQVQAMLSEEDAIAAGGQDGHIAFGSGSFQLYVNETTIVPTSAGGLFVPKVYVSGSLKDTEVSAILGGLDGTGIFYWTPTSNFKVESVAAKDTLFKGGVTTLTVDIYAENDKLDDFAYALFDISADGTVELTSQGLEDGKQRYKNSSAGTLGFGITALLLILTSLLSQ